MKNLLVISTLVAAMAACACNRSPAPAAVNGGGAGGSSATGPWNGGKPGAPFTVTSAVEDVVPTDVDVTLLVTVTPTRACSKLTTVVRGIDGVAVRASGERTAFVVCQVGVDQPQPVVVRVPAGVAGYLVVDVTAEVDGRATAGSYSIPLRAAGASFARHTTGDVVITPTGERVVKMPATER
jgi:hypothetical protein